MFISAIHTYPKFTRVPAIEQVLILQSSVVLEKALESSLDWFDSDQSILKEINPEYSLEGLLLKLKLEYFGYLMWRADSLEKTLMLGKIEGKKKREWKRVRWLDSITNSTDMNFSKLRDIVKDREAWFAAVVKSQKWLCNWTTTITAIFLVNLGWGSEVSQKGFVLLSSGEAWDSEHWVKEGDS